MLRCWRHQGGGLRLHSPQVENDKRSVKLGKFLVAICETCQKIHCVFFSTTTIVIESPRSIVIAGFLSNAWLRKLDPFAPPGNPWVCCGKSWLLRLGKRLLRILGFLFLNWCHMDQAPWLRLMTTLRNCLFARSLRYKKMNNTHISLICCAFWFFCSLISNKNSNFHGTLKKIPQ